MHGWRACDVTCIGASEPVGARPSPTGSPPCARGGYVIIMRHGATHQDQADTDPLNLANVAKQRQLNDAGRAKAREIGAAMKKLGIPVGQVDHQPVFPRHRDRRLLGFGEPQPKADVTRAARSSRRSRTTGGPRHAQSHLRWPRPLSNSGSRLVGCAPTCDGKRTDGPVSPSLPFLLTRDEKGRPELGPASVSIVDRNLSA